MSNIDKQALREAAEKATDSRARLDLMESVFDDNGDVTPEAQDDIRICMSFNDLTNPATVLALLDELEAAKQDAARWFRSFEKAVSVGARHEERIAELEAREVKLPQRFDVQSYSCSEEPDGEWYARDDVLAALANAGVRFYEEG